MTGLNHNGFEQHDRIARLKRQATTSEKLAAEAPTSRTTPAGPVAPIATTTTTTPPAAVTTSESTFVYSKHARWVPIHDNTNHGQP